MRLSTETGSDKVVHNVVQETQRIEEALPILPAQDGLVKQVLATLPKRTETGDQVAAIHGGYVTRRQRLESARIYQFKK